MRIIGLSQLLPRHRDFKIRPPLPLTMAVSGIFFGGLCPSLLPALTWKHEEAYRYSKLDVSTTKSHGFKRLTSKTTGITFTNRLGEIKAAKNQIRLNGSGVTLGDYNGDDRCDIYLCRLEGPNTLYRNSGNWEFQNVTRKAGVGFAGHYSTGAVFADVNGDEALDLLVNTLGQGTSLFMNNGKGEFSPKRDSGLKDRFAAMSMALADVDSDGDLDLYVANYRTSTVRSTGLKYLVTDDGRKKLRPQDRDRFEITSEGYLREVGEPDFLYLNDGKGHFSAVSWTAGRFQSADGNPLSETPTDWGLSASFRDLNGDRLPDLYVCNDFWSPDRIWINQGNGRFQAIEQAALQQTSTFSMGVDFADINRDGREDFFVLDMLSRRHTKRMTQASLIGLQPEPVGVVHSRPQVERNTLFLQRRDGTYAEIAQLAGVEASGWSWCPVFLDVDLDGHEDLLVTTGHGFDTQDKDAQARLQKKGPFPPDKVHRKLLEYPPLRLPNYAFKNHGDLTFSEVGTKWGFDRTGISHGMALADLDNDGDQDIVANSLNAEAGVYRNEASRPRLAVQLTGKGANSEGIGARIRVKGGPLPQQQAMMKGGRYLSSDQAMRTFAAGSETNDLTIRVEWANGQETRIDHAKANRIYKIAQSSRSAQKAKAERSPQAGKKQPPPHEAALPFFEDVSSLIDHEHVETPYNDFSRQPGLSRRLSQLGPGIAWTDLDRDGWDDLVIGSGRGGGIALFKNEKGKDFHRIRRKPLTQKRPHDHTSVLSQSSIDHDPKQTLLAGTTNYEKPQKASPLLEEYDLAHHAIKTDFFKSPSSPGPLAMTDITGDGTLELFVGERCLPGAYPLTSSSFIFSRTHSRWQPDRKRTAALKDIGRVSGAAWGDIDDDAVRELILACDWGAVRIFKPRNGRLAEMTTNWGLKRYQGWWNGVATGDFNNDGRLDLVATNWGRNTRYESYRHHPIRLYYGHFDHDGLIELVETYWDKDLRKIVPFRPLDSLAKGIPPLRGRFKSHHDYANAGIRSILGPAYPDTNIRTANWLETTLFINRGSRFEAMPLPIEAQFAPCFEPVVADYNGDGNEDLFLSQNFFALHPQVSRTDAGRGLWLQGDGTGHFEAVAGSKTGIRVYGEQRGAAVSDYNRDGRVDLAVTQNGTETKLFRNRKAVPGLRLRLRGPKSNPRALGAQIRLVYADGRAGPLREIQAGAGYWSQDSAIQILGQAGKVTSVRVRWPNGQNEEIPLDPKTLSQRDVIELSPDR